MDFGKALVALKDGKKIARDGWNGKGMFVYYVPSCDVPARSNAIKGMYPFDLLPYDAYIAMKTVDNTIVPWLASQKDILADDWVVV